MLLSKSQKEVNCRKCNQYIPTKSLTLVTRHKSKKVTRLCGACSIEELNNMKDALQAKRIPKAIRLYSAIVIKGKDLTGPCYDCKKVIQADRRCMHVRALKSDELYRGTAKTQYKFCGPCSVKRIDDMLRWLK